MGTILKVAAGVFLGGAALEAANVFVLAKLVTTYKDSVEGFIHDVEDKAARTKKAGEDFDQAVNP